MNKIHAFIFCASWAAAWAGPSDTLSRFEGRWTGTCNYADNETTSKNAVSLKITRRDSNRGFIKFEIKGKGKYVVESTLTWNESSKRWSATEYGANYKPTPYISKTLVKIDYLMGSLNLSTYSKDPTNINFSWLNNVWGTSPAATLCELNSVK